MSKLKLANKARAIQPYCQYFFKITANQLKSKNIISKTIKNMIRWKFEKKDNNYSNFDFDCFIDYRVFNKQRKIQKRACQRQTDWGQQHWHC